MSFLIIQIDLLVFAGVLPFLGKFTILALVRGLVMETQVINPVTSVTQYAYPDRGYGEVRPQTHPTNNVKKQDSTKSSIRISPA